MNYNYTPEKGQFTNYHTRFGRHYAVFRELEKILSAEKPSEMNCLIVGPGKDDDPPDKFTRTYQPYELANILINSNVPDFNIDVIDINPEVISEMQKTPTLIKADRNITKYYKKTPKTEKNSKEYMASFFRQYTVSEFVKNKVVLIPPEISSRIHPKKGDLVKDKLPVNKYDLVICTTLISHYSPEATHYPFDPTSKLIKKVEDTLKINGYLIDSDQTNSGQNWEHLFEFNWNFTLLHNGGAQLRRKIQKHQPIVPEK